MIITSPPKKFGKHFLTVVTIIDMGIVWGKLNRAKQTVTDRMIMVI